MAKTLFQKVWENHVVVEEAGRPSVLYIDLHLIHEVTSPQAFSGLRARGLKVRRPDRTVATMDHSTPTLPKHLQVIDDEARAQLSQLEKNCAEFGIRLFPLGDSKNGIVHVVGPERGFTQPGMTIVCGDSHTSTHGAFGSLAFGIGTSEVEHVLASQCLLQTKPKTMEVRVEGTLSPSVTAKDIILALIAKIGTAGGTGYVLEYTGSAIRALEMEARMTVCNMSIEGGARAGMIAPDDYTYQFVSGREYAPKGADFDKAVERWKKLPSDEGATYDTRVDIDASALEPMITYGTHPGMGVGITQALPSA
jgi:3-isopropylmalate/(R)-2-methylmalate dehydratase large subunit